MVVHAVCKVSCCSCDCPPVTVVHGIAICLYAYIQGSDTEAKLSDIWTALSNHIRQDCSCSFILQQHFFSCLGTEKAETVVYIAELSYTIIRGVVNVPSLLTSWVDSGPTITVNFIQLQVDTTCPVVIDSLKSESCIVVSPTPPTDMPTDLPTDVTVIAVVTCVILLLVVVTIVAVIVVAVAVFRRKQSKYKYVSTPHHHSIHTTVRCRFSVVYCTWCTVVVHSSVLCSPLAVQAQPSPPQPRVRV